MSSSMTPSVTLPRRQIQGDHGGKNDRHQPQQDDSDRVPIAAATRDSNRSIEEIRSGLQAFHKKRRLERAGESSAPVSSPDATTSSSSSTEGDSRLREFHSKFLSARLGNQA